jgi:hypothetical protein
LAERDAFESWLNTPAGSGAAGEEAA